MKFEKERVPHDSSKSTQIARDVPTHVNPSKISSSISCREARYVLNQLISNLTR